MTLRKRQLIAGYMVVLGALCLVYALMPFLPAIAWRIHEARTDVQTAARKRAIAQYRVKQIMLARHNVSRVPDVKPKAFASMQIRGAGAEAAQYLGSRSVDPQVIDLLRTVSAQTAVVGERTSSEEMRDVSNRNAIPTERPAAAGTPTPSGIKVALAAAQAGSANAGVSQSKSGEQQPRGNSIRISSITVDMPVFEGDESVLARGAWLMPGSAFPGKGNTVISAHRYQSFGAKSFYHLDKVNVGDVMSVWWNGKEYQYRVVSNTVVRPDRVDVLNKSSHAKLTLVTCDPVFSTKNRRIVTADLIAD